MTFLLEIRKEGLVKDEPLVFHYFRFNAGGPSSPIPFMAFDTFYAVRMHPEFHFIEVMPCNGTSDKDFFLVVVEAGTAAASLPLHGGLSLHIYWVDAVPHPEEDPINVRRALEEVEIRTGRATKSIRSMDICANGHLVKFGEGREHSSGNCAIALVLSTSRERYAPDNDYGMQSLADTMELFACKRPLPAGIPFETCNLCFKRGDTCIARSIPHDTTTRVATARDLLLRSVWNDDFIDNASVGTAMVNDMFIQTALIEDGAGFVRWRSASDAKSPVNIWAGRSGRNWERQCDADVLISATWE